MRSGSDERLDELIALSLGLAAPALDLVILAEGNTSARIDRESFWVKASGTPLAEAAGPGDYVAVAIAPLLETLREAEPLDDAEIKQRLRSAALGGDDELPAPSIETYVHAACLEVGGATFVAHTHPTALNSLLCTEHARAAYEGVLFPDEAVVCGPRPLIVRYAAPGLELGRRTLTGLKEFMARHGEPPRVVLLLNHGLFALGCSGEEAAAITAMVVKAARIRLGALAAGRLRFLPPDQAQRLYGREDERARRQRLAGRSA
jgi:rhamnose utilization protein RhaD (predicted bifunctional aldolase and dehydrogenase)